MSRKPSGIVLAGGRATRFGSDKLQATLDGRPLVHRPIAALAEVCAEVILVAGPDSTPPLPASPGVPLRIVRDDEPGAGPLAALITGLHEAVGEVAIVVAGDMPGLVPALLADLARRARARDVDAAALRDGDVTRPLPSAVRRTNVIEAARRIRADGASSLRALLGTLRVDAIDEAHWRRLDPAATTLLDVDRPEDLEHLLALIM